MNSWVFTIPFTFLLAAVLLWLVLRAVLRGDFDDWEGPAARHFLDEDGCPERDDERSMHPALPLREGQRAVGAASRPGSASLAT